MRRRVDGVEGRRNRRPQADGSSRHATGPHSRPDEPAPRSSGAPWHFWLVVAMATLYLGWRAVEGVVWLVQWFAGVIG
ncbi:hypothetical protein [Candidatus Poriferisodalis sp.]|uniref:hypothetical protein n=1 Tax=Candidatus Poriferisodalis sp. TaxID=3101277 RepID=UPI003B01074F